VPYFVVSYQYTGDVDARMSVRPQHRDFLSGLVPALVMSGPTDTDGALLVFEADSADAVTALLDDDPFRKEGFIGERRVIGWTPVLGRAVESGTIS
jgi:uncharacterized protein YciI